MFVWEGSDFKTETQETREKVQLFKSTSCSCQGSGFCSQYPHGIHMSTMAYSHIVGQSNSSGRVTSHIYVMVRKCLSRGVILILKSGNTSKQRAPLYYSQDFICSVLSGTVTICIAIATELQMNKINTSVPQLVTI